MWLLRCACAKTSSISDVVKNQRTIGIDPGTIITGYGIVDEKGSQGYTAVDYGCIRPPANAPLTSRYLIIYESICSLLDKYTPDALAVETQYVRNNVQSAIKLGMARGMVILAATQRQIPIYEYEPTKAKKAVVGNGRASKQQVNHMVQHLLGLKAPPQPDDASDALALAICHVQAFHFQSCLARMI